MIPFVGFQIRGLTESVGLRILHPMAGAVLAGRERMKTKFSAEGWTLTVMLTKTTNNHSRNILAMCKKVADVQRCASMGDFQISKAEPTANV